MVNLAIAIEIFSIIMIFTAIGLLLNVDGSKEQKLMGCFMGGALIQNAGYLLELIAPVPEAALTAIKIQYLGSLFIPVCYSWFMFSYCYKKPPEKFLGLLLLIDFFTLGLVFTCDLHSFYYSGTKWLVTPEGHHYLSLSYGPGYLLFLIFGCAVPFAMSVYILFGAAFNRKVHRADRKYKLILFLSLLPVVALVSYSLKLTYVFDPSPFVLGVVLSIVVILVWSRRNYDFGRLAADVVLASMGDGIITLDDDKRIVSYNQAAESIFKELSSHAPGSSIEDMADFPEGVLNENEKREFNIGSHFYESHVKQIPDRNGKSQGYAILILDVTETKNYIDEIKSVREQAEQANVAKSEFLANMSHEIRTPMNAIVGLSDIIMEESRGRKVYTYACDIKSASQNLLAIINDILDLSKVEAGKMELVLNDYYLKSAVNEVVHMMDIAASQHGLLLKCGYDMSVPCQYYGDEGRIKQILINILNNAVKFTKEGYVKMSVSGRPGSKENYEDLVFRVEDTGCGIRSENLEKIFEDFKQVDSKRNRSVEGTGLGLSITKHLVQLMEGKIEVESVYGEGTVFTVIIPQKIVDSRTLEEMPEVPAREEKQAEPFTADGCKVLVVDDNLINRKVAIGFLKRYKFDLSECESGAEAIELVKKTKFDIIFMDHMMPEMDGIEAVRIIRAECGDNGKTPVIIALTANAMEGVRERFLKNGFQDFITKPLDRNFLDDVLVKWVPGSLKNVQEPAESDGMEDGTGKTSSRINITGIDAAEALELYSGDVTVYRKILDLYCIDGRRKITYLRELIEKKDYRNYMIEVHGLKSASANIGAMELSNHAREHEEAASKKDEDFIMLHFPELISSYEKQIGYIQDYLDKGHGPAGAGAGENIKAIDKENLIKGTREALDNLENFHSRECAGKIEKLLEYQLDNNVRTKLEEVQGQLRMYEDDMAELLLHQLLKWLDKED